MEKKRSVGMLVERIILCSFTIAIFFCLVTVCYAETFYLKNGWVIEGTVIEENAKGFKIKNGMQKTPGCKGFLGLPSICYLNRDEIEKIEEAGALNKEFLGKDAESAKKSYREHQSWEYYRSGIDFAANGEFEKAKKEFQNSLKVDEFYTPAKQSLLLIEDAFNQRIKREVAIRMFKVGISDDWTSRITELEDIVNLESDYMMAHTILGIAYLDNEMLDKAMVELKKVVQIEPNSAIAHNNLGVVYVYKKMFDDASQEFKMALQFNSNLTEAHFNLELMKPVQALIAESDALRDMPIAPAFKTSSVFVYKKSGW